MASRLMGTMSSGFINQLMIITQPSHLQAEAGVARGPPRKALHGRVGARFTTTPETRQISTGKARRVDVEPQRHVHGLDGR